jgi:hypothetical protein
MRVIIRFSLDGDDGTLTSALKTILKRNHLSHKRRTGTYEGSGTDVDIDSLKIALDSFWDKIKAQEKANLDHFWMYVDKRSPGSKTRTETPKKSTQRKAK